MTVQAEVHKAETDDYPLEEGVTGSADEEVEEDEEDEKEDEEDEEEDDEEWDVIQEQVDAGKIRVKVQASNHNKRECNCNCNRIKRVEILNLFSL